MLFLPGWFIYCYAGLKCMYVVHKRLILGRRRSRMLDVPCGILCHGSWCECLHRMPARPLLVECWRRILARTVQRVLAGLVLQLSRRPRVCVVSSWHIHFLSNDGNFMHAMPARQVHYRWLDKRMQILQPRKLLHSTGWHCRQQLYSMSPGDDWSGGRLCQMPGGYLLHCIWCGLQLSVQRM